MIYHLIFASIFILSCSKASKGDLVNDPSKILKRISIVGLVEIEAENSLLSFLNTVWSKSRSKNYSREEIDELLQMNGGSINISLYEDGRFHARLVALSSGIDKLLPVFQDLIINPVFEDRIIQLEKKIACEELLRLVEKPILLAVSVAKHFLFQKDWIDCDKLESITPPQISSLKESISFRDVRYITNIGDENVHSFLNSFITKISNSNKVKVKEFKNPRISTPAIIWIKAPFDQVTTLMVGESENLKSKNRYALKFFSALTSDGFDSLVFKRIRSEKGLAYLTGAGWSADFEKGLLYFVVQHARDSLPDVTGKIFDILVDITDNEIPADEINKVFIRENRKLQFDKEDQLEKSVQGAIFDLFGLPKDDDLRYVNYLQSVKPKDLKKIFKNHLLHSIKNKFLILIVHRDDPREKLVGDLQKINFVKVLINDRFRLLY